VNKLWSQSIARRSLLGGDTMNPTIAARSLLERGRGKRAVARAIRKQHRRRKPSHKWNPDIAGLASLVPGGSVITSLLGGLGKRFKAPSEVRAGRLAPAIVQSANAGNLTAARGLIERAARPMNVAESNVWKAAAAQLAASTIAAVKANLASIPQADQADPERFAASVVASAYQPMATAAAGTPAATLLGVLGQPGTIRAIASAAKPRRQARGRYPTYSDHGRQRYSSKPPGSELRIPAGATMTPGTPYSFFRGAVGGGGALATAGQVALAAGAGIAAYLVTQRLLAALGGRAQKREEAGVAAALALRQARADLAKQQGYPITPAQAKEMGAAYKQQLIELGYDPVTFTRKRSGVEGFLEAYNPFGG